MNRPDETLNERKKVFVCVREREKENERDYE